jgi:cytochrome P450
MPELLPSTPSELPFGEPGAYEPTAYANFCDRLHDAKTLTFQDPNTGFYAVWNYTDVERILRSDHVHGISRAQTLKPMTGMIEIAKDPRNWQHLSRLIGARPATADCDGTAALAEKHHKNKSAILAPHHGLSLGEKPMAERYGEELDELIGKLIRHVGETASNEHVDIATDFVDLLTASAVCRVTGEPDEKSIMTLAAAQVALLDRPLEGDKLHDAVAALARLRHNKLLLAKMRLASPTSDLTSQLVKKRGIRTAADIGMNIDAAGVSTTNGTEKNILRRIAHDEPELWDMIDPDPNSRDAQRNFWIELERTETSLIGWGSATTADVLLHDNRTVIPKDQRILLLLGAANRDPRRFKDPHTFNADRYQTPSQSTPLTFGVGRHVCVGRELSRFTIRRSLRALKGQYPNFRLLEPDNGFTYDNGYMFRTLLGPLVAELGHTA